LLVSIEQVDGRELDFSADRAETERSV
jgi:hypothetical protein